MVENKKAFDVEVDGKVLKLAVVRPTHRVAQEGTLVYNRAFREAVEPKGGMPGAMLRRNVEKVLREQKLWDDAKQAEYEAAVKEIHAAEMKLARGGCKLSEARDAAVAAMDARDKISALFAQRNEYDAVTAEAQAEEARNNYYVSACTVYADTGKNYFQSYEDMLSRGDDPVVYAASRAFGDLFFGLAPDWRKDLFEYKFLSKYKLVDEKLRLVNKDGKLVDRKGRLVDEKGRLVNPDGELVDTEGNPLTEDGAYKVEFAEFEDDVFESKKSIQGPAAAA